MTMLHLDVTLDEEEESTMKDRASSSASGTVPGTHSEECTLMKDRASSSASRIVSGTHSEATTETSSRATSSSAETLSVGTSSSSQDSGCEETPPSIAVDNLFSERPLADSAQDTADRLLGCLVRLIGDHLPSSLLKKIWLLPLQAQAQALEATVEFAQSDLIRALEDGDKNSNIVAKLEQEVNSRSLSLKEVENHKLRNGIEEAADKEGLQQQWRQSERKAQKENAVSCARRALAARMCGEQAVVAHHHSHRLCEFQMADIASHGNDLPYRALPLESMPECDDPDMMEFANGDFTDPHPEYFMNFMYLPLDSASELATASNEMLTHEAWLDLHASSPFMADWYPSQQFLEDDVNSMQDFYLPPDSKIGDGEVSEAGTVTSSSSMWTYSVSEAGKSNYMTKRHWRQAKEKDFRVQFCNNGCTKDITTLMIRNVPNVCTSEFLMEALDSLGFQEKYDFVYVPMDSGSLRSIGYAFVNFIWPEAAQSCMDTLKNSFALCEKCAHYKRPAWVTAAHLQGLRENLEHYKKTTVNFEIVEVGQQVTNCFRPVVIKGIPDSLAEVILSEIGAEQRQIMEDTPHNPTDRISWCDMSDSCSTALEAFAPIADVSTTDMAHGSPNFLPPHRTPSRTPSPSPMRYGVERLSPGALPAQLPVKHTFIHYESKEEPVTAEPRDGVAQLSRSSSDPCVLLHGDGSQVAAYQEWPELGGPKSKTAPRSTKHWEDCAVWEMTKQFNVAIVRSAPSTTADEISVKKSSSKVYGFEVDGWVELVDEPGYIAIRDPSGRRLLRKVQTEFDACVCGAAFPSRTHSRIKFCRKCGRQRPEAELRQEKAILGDPAELSKHAPAKNSYKSPKQERWWDKPAWETFENTWRNSQGGGNAKWRPKER